MVPSTGSRRRWITVSCNGPANWRSRIIFGSLPHSADCWNCCGAGGAGGAGCCCAGAAHGHAAIKAASAAQGRAVQMWRVTAPLGEYICKLPTESEFDRHARAPDMFVTAAIGIAAIDHGRKAEVQPVRDADADPGFAPIISGVERNGGFAGRRRHQHRRHRGRGDDAAPRFLLVVEPEPIAAECAAVAEALVPSAAELVPVAVAPSPKAAPPFDAVAPAPTAIEPVAIAPVPIAMALGPVDAALKPMATDPDCVAWALLPIAIALAPEALAAGPLLLTFT